MEKFDLTFPQRNIWLVENFYDSKRINMISGSLVINKDFDLHKAEKTVNEFARLNDGMRLRLVLEEGTPKQYVAEYKHFETDKIDVSGKTEKEIENIKQEYIDKEIDIIDKPLFSYLLIDRGNGQGEIFFKAHHLICDGWSGSKIATGLAETYDKILEGKEEFESYPSYVEYIAKEQEYTKSDKFKADEEFWKEYLNGFSEPVGIKESSNHSLNANRYSVKLNEKLNTLILDYCKENKVSPYSVFMTAIAIYLERITEKQDIIIGTPILNRGNFSEKQMQGMFVSTMPVRFKIDEGETFKDLCIKNARESMTLFRHQRFPFEITSENLKKQEGITDNMFKVMVSYQNARAKFEKENTYHMTWTFTNAIQDQLEVHIVDLNDDGILEIDYDYVNELFEDKEIEYIAKRIETIIEDGIINNKTIETIEIMPQEEKDLILNVFNDTKRDYPKDKTVIDLFEEQVEKTPDNIALVFENEELTYRELNNRANGLANYLRERGVKENDIVPIMMERGFDTIVAMLAVLKAGAAYTPIDTNFPQERKEYIIKDCNSKLVLSNCKNELNEVTIVDIGEIKTKFKTNIVRNINSGNNIAYIIYTSGTTGVPKGAMISNDNFYNFVCITKDLVGFDTTTRVASFSTCTFDIFLLENFIALCSGGSVVLTNEVESKLPSGISDIIENNNVNAFFMTPTRLQLLVNDDNYAKSLRKLDFIMLGGEVFPKDLFAKIRKYTNARVINGYGPTEITVWSSVKEIETENGITLGKILGNTTTYILDSKNRLLPIFVNGEIVIGGKGVGLGYLNNKELTTKKFVKIDYLAERVYKSGDLGCFDCNGELIFKGRLDGQVKIHGLRIEIEEIEKNLNEFKNVIRTAVKVQNDKIYAFYTSDEELNVKEIKAFLSERLPKYMVPSNVYRVDKFNIKVSGKIDKESLQVPKERSKKFVAKTETEKQIVKLVRLSNENISISEDTFLEMGMDSIDMIKLLGYINNEFNINVSMNELYNTHDTIDGLAKHIDEKKKEKRNIKEELTDKEYYPLTDVQKGIFNSYGINTNSLKYNIPFELVFNNTVDVEKLCGALKKVLKANKTFNTNIIVDENGLFQKEVASKINIEVENVSESEYKKIKQNFVKPIDLLSSKLYDFRILKTSKNVYILANISHIIFDGTSLTIFLQDLKNAYAGRKINNKRFFGQTMIKAEMTKQTKEYLDSKEYFINIFSEELPDNTFIEDKKRPAIKTENGDTLKLGVTEKLSEKIKEYSRLNNLTLNSIFLGVFNILMSKYMYNEDIILGIVTDGRRGKEELDAIGMFVKTIPLRTKISYTNKTKEFFDSIQKSLIELIDHSDYTYEQLIKDLKIKRDSSRNPLFDVVFAYQNMGKSTGKILENNVIINELNTNTSKYDLTMEIIPQEKTFQIGLQYNTDIFNRDTIEGMLKNYIIALENSINTDKLQDIEIISKEEKALIINEFNNTQTKYPVNKTVHQIFEENVIKYPEKDAVVFGNERISYKELNEKANKFARYLIQKGVEPGDIISIMLDKSIEYMIAAIAILKCNAAYTPIIEDLPNSRAKYMMENAQSKFIISNKQYYRNISDIEPIFIDEESLYDSNSCENIGLENNSNTLLHVIYTSGSTGVPKGNMIKHKGMVRLLLNTNYVDYDNNDVMMASASLTFDISGFELWGAMMYGMTLHMLTKEQVMDVNFYKNYIDNNKITTTFLATPIFHMMVDTKISIFDNLKTVYVGGEVLLPRYTNMLIDHNNKIKIYNEYGPAEITVICCSHLVDKKYNTDIPLGKIASNNRCYIVDKCNNICPINVPGELYVAGDGMGFGYVNRPDLTAERFVYIDKIKENIYKSGDLTLWNKFGEVRYAGRIDTQIKIRGQRIELSEIQNKITEIPGIKEAVAIVSENENGNKYIIAYYTANEDMEQQKIYNYLKEYLPSYMVPYKMQQIDKMPYNQNGKIARNMLPKVDLNENKIKVLPQNDLQKNILNIFIETLQNQNIDMESDFFENGGDSLMVAQLIAKLQLKNIEISYGDIFKYKTPIEIYNYLTKQAADIDISESLKDIDYSKIDKLLDKNRYNSNDKIKKEKLGNVLLTGVTGFLGIHILRELAKQKTVDHIYCLVRDKDGIQANDRFEKHLNNFFDKKTNENILSKTTIIKGDITSPNILEESVKIDTIINPAAYVKHYGDYDKFYKVNVQGVKNLINYCIKNNCKLVHVSTLSVSGNISESGQIIQKNIKSGTEYSETNLFIGQSLNNNYAYTKFLAELEILKSIIENKLNAQVIRVGNLTGRYDDGKFQPNVEDNAFSNRIKAITQMKMIPTELADKYLELTPIDYTAKAVTLLSMINNKDWTVYHLFNDNHAEMKFVLNILKQYKLNIKLKDKEAVKTILKEYMEDEEKLNIISGIIPDISKEGTLEYNETTIVKEDFTKKILAEFDFYWPTVTKEYFEKYLLYLDKIGFINLKGEENDSI